MFNYTLGQEQWATFQDPAAQNKNVALVCSGENRLDMLLSTATPP